jgi:hypothetical protein
VILIGESQYPARLRQRSLYGRSAFRGLEHRSGKNDPLNGALRLATPSGATRIPAAQEMVRVSALFPSNALTINGSPQPEGNLRLQAAILGEARFTDPWLSGCPVAM